MNYEVVSFFAILLFALVHLGVPKVRQLGWVSKGRFLSFGGGVALSYVFIDLLPKLGKSDALVQAALQGSFPYFERHVFVLTLLGFLLFFLADRTHSPEGKKKKLCLCLSSYALFNFLIGYAVADSYNPEVQPLGLFTFAMALHYFTNDYSLSESHDKTYRTTGKWLLIISLFLGWVTGLMTDLPSTGVALISAFIGGGVILNVTRHELPSNKPNNTKVFLFSALGYTILLLALRATP